MSFPERKRKQIWKRENALNYKKYDIQRNKEMIIISFNSISLIYQNDIFSIVTPRYKV